MPLIAKGTKTLKTIPIDSIEDIYDVKNRILNKFDYTYALSSQQKYEEDEFDYDQSLKDFHKSIRETDEDLYSFLGQEIYYSSSIYEPVSIYFKKNKYKFVLNSEFDLYKCDVCKCFFLDYKNYYSDEKSINVKNGKECCDNCYTVMLKKHKKRNILKALSKLSDENGIKISKQQKYICELLKGKPNVQIGYFFADMILENDKVIIEYDGSGHWLQTSFKSNVTKQDVDERDRLRDKYLNKKGYKVLRIISEKDLLPSDKEILKLYKKALRRFNKGENRVILNILDLYKESELRKITNDLLEVK